MDAEAARIEAHYVQLPADGWTSPSRCDGWTVRDLLKHLVATETYHHACLDGRVAALLEELVGRGATSVAEFNALGIADLDGVGDDELIERFRRDDAETRRRFRERGDGEVDTSVGMYPARWQAFHLAGELATHADDAFVAVPEGDRAARLDWRTRFSCFVLAEAQPDLRTERGDGRVRVTGEGLDADLADDDFVQIVAGRDPASAVPADVRARLSQMP
jgi:uncharacterized protein (TIGR03083 family)